MTNVRTESICRLLGYLGLTGTRDFAHPTNCALPLVAQLRETSQLDPRSQVDVGLKTECLLARSIIEDVIGDAVIPGGRVQVLSQEMVEVVQTERDKVARDLNLLWRNPFELNLQKDEYIVAVQPFAVTRTRKPALIPSKLPESPLKGDPFLVTLGTNHTGGRILLPWKRGGILWQSNRRVVSDYLRGMQASLPIRDALQKDDTSFFGELGDQPYGLVRKMGREHLESLASSLVALGEIQLRAWEKVGWTERLSGLLGVSSWLNLLLVWNDLENKVMDKLMIS